MDVASSLELLEELVLVGIECLVKMGLDIVVEGREAVELGVKGDDLGSKVDVDLGTKFGAVGLSLFVLLIVMVADG